MSETNQTAPATVAAQPAAPAPVAAAPQAQPVAIIPKAQQLEMIDLAESTSNVFEVVTRPRDVTNSFGVVTGRVVASQTIRARKNKDIAKALGLEGKANLPALEAAKLLESDTIKHQITQRVVQLDSDDRFTGKEATVSFPKSGIRVVTFKLVETVRPQRLQAEIDELKKRYGKTEDEIIAMMKRQLAANSPAADQPPIDMPDTKEPEPGNKPEDKQPEPPKAPAQQQQGRRR